MTTANERFSNEKTYMLAALVLCRFGWNNEDAAAAWRRMLGNSCEDFEFAHIAAMGAGKVRRMK